MPLSKYFKGKGEKVMANMKSQYGPEKGREVFYATANKQKMAPKRKKKRVPPRPAAAQRRPTR